MIPITFCVILLSACVVKCETENVYTDLEGKTIDKEEICAKKTCITKCCPKDHFIPNQNSFKCLPNKIIKKFRVDIDYTSVDVYSIDNALSTIIKTTKNISESPYFIIHSNMYQKYDPQYSTDMYQVGCYLTEDGKLAKYRPNRYYRYALSEGLEFCVDIMVNPTKQRGEIGYKLLISPQTTQLQDETIKYTYTAIAMLISCFFLLLTLVVYLLLPQLRTIGGRVLMALVFTLALAFLVKAVINLVQLYGTMETSCKFVSPLFYYAILSSFFWMNVMSFDVFWTLRGTRKCREIHRRGENFKFMTYCLYAYGIPSILTVAAVIIDNVEVGPDVIKPFFNMCQAYNEEVTLYLYIPMGILIFTNCVLFMLTTYNIWMTKKGVNQCKESRNTKSNENKFGLYLRLSMIMGIAWVLEVIQFANDLPTWLFILLNAYNVLIGVAIFFLFVFKKRILSMLCARFNIKCSFVENMPRSQYSKTESSRVPGSTKSNISNRKTSLESDNKLIAMSTISETCIE